MRWFKWILTLALLVGSAAPDVASADRGRWSGHRHHHHGGARLGLYFGVPLGWGWQSPFYAYPGPYAYSPYYAYPPATVVVPASPPVYVERGDDDVATSRSDGYWYYCDRPEGYYPYVKECAGGWERVAPRPSR